MAGPRFDSRSCLCCVFGAFDDVGYHIGCLATALQPDKVMYLCLYTTPRNILQSIEWPFHEQTLSNINHLIEEWQKRVDFEQKMSQ